MNEQTKRRRIRTESENLALSSLSLSRCLASSPSLTPYAAVRLRFCTAPSHSSMRPRRCARLDTHAEAEGGGGRGSVWKGALAEAPE